MRPTKRPIIEKIIGLIGLDLFMFSPIGVEWLGFLLELPVHLLFPLQPPPSSSLSSLPVTADCFVVLHLLFAALRSSVDPRRVCSFSSLPWNYSFLINCWCFVFSLFELIPFSFTVSFFFLFLLLFVSFLLSSKLPEIFY